MKPNISFNSDLSESPGYNIGDVPISCIMSGKGSDAPTHPCHWHPDIQFIYALSGEKSVYVNGKTVTIKKGQGVFINSRRLHYCIFPEDRSTVSLTVLIHPSIFANVSETAKDYSVKKFGPNSEDYIVLSTECGWHERILISLTEMYSETLKADANPIRLISLGNLVIADICANINTDRSADRSAHMQQSLLKMTDYLSANYQDNISVDDIAKAGSVSRSQCTRLFKRILRESPSEYLRKLRIEKSKALLRNTNLPVTEVALSCGIASTSYFISIFKDETGLTPLGYRKQFQQTISTN